jgi:hypothetical protein
MISPEDFGGSIDPGISLYLDPEVFVIPAGKLVLVWSGVDGDAENGVYESDGLGTYLYSASQILTIENVGELVVVAADLSFAEATADSSAYIISTNDGIVFGLTPVAGSAFKSSLGLGDSALLDVGTSAGTVAAGDDSRLVTISANAPVSITSGVISLGSLDTSQTTSGIFTAARLGSGTANADTFLRGDLTWSDDVPLQISVKNTSGGALTKGTPVYATGTVGATAVIEIAGADASVGAKMPSIGLLMQNLANNGTGLVMIMGTITGLNTTGYSINSGMFVAAGGGLTNTRPTAATHLVQNVARVTRVHATTGSVMVLGPGRTNDVPNLIATNFLATSGTASANTFLRGDQSWSAIEGVSPAFIAPSGVKAYGIPGFRASGSAATAAPTAGRLNYEPWFVEASTTLDRLAVEVVTTPGAAGKLLRMGIYNANTSWVPTTLVVDAGTVLVDSVGLKVATINVTLPPGRYICAWVVAITGTIPILRQTAGNVNYWPSISATAGGAGPYQVSQYLDAQTAVVAAGLPATATAPDVYGTLGITSTLNYQVRARWA